MQYESTLTEIYVFPRSVVSHMLWVDRWIFPAASLKWLKFNTHLGHLYNSIPLQNSSALLPSLLWFGELKCCCLLFCQG